MKRPNNSKDFQFTETVTKSGRIRMDAVYVGPHFVFSDPAAAARAKWLLPVCAVLGWALYIGALFPRSGASRLLFAVLPFVFTALPLWALTESAFSLLTQRMPMIRSAADRLSKKLPQACLAGMILCGVTLLGMLAAEVFFRSRLNRWDILFSACALLFAGVFALARAQGKALAVREQS